MYSRCVMFGRQAEFPLEHVWLAWNKRIVAFSRDLSPRAKWCAEH